MIQAKEEFKVGKNTIGNVESSFISEFGNDEITQGIFLKSHKLGRGMKYEEIIKEFKVEECTLGDVLETLKNATEDMKDGYANIFYIKGHPSHVVFVRWCGGGWGVRAWDRGSYACIAGSRV